MSSRKIRGSYANPNNRVRANDASMHNGLMSSKDAAGYDQTCGIHGAAQERKGAKKATSAARRRHDKEIINEELYFVRAEKGGCAMTNDEKWIITREDWYPSFDGGKLQVSWHSDRTWHPELEKHGAVYAWRVTVWGADDHGMELSFKSSKAAKKMFDKVSDFVTKNQLKELGFVLA